MPQRHYTFCLPWSSLQCPGMIISNPLWCSSRVRSPPQQICWSCPLFHLLLVHPSKTAHPDHLKLGFASISTARRKVLQRPALVSIININTDNSNIKAGGCSRKVAWITPCRNLNDRMHLDSFWRSIPPLFNKHTFHSIHKYYLKFQKEFKALEMQNMAFETSLISFPASPLYTFWFISLRGGLTLDENYCCQPALQRNWRLF